MIKSREGIAVSDQNETDQVDRGVPIPPPGGYRIKLTGLEVGDSVRVDYVRRASISGTIKYHQMKRAPEERFTRRVMRDKDGAKYVRVWRIA